MPESGKNGQSNKDGDFLQSTIGNFGRWQFKISLLMALLKFPIAWFQLSIVFLAPPTQFWCKPPEKYANLTTDKWLSMNRHNPSLLKREGLNTGFCEITNLESDVNVSVNCINGYIYNTTVFHSSIVTEWDLVCENKRLVDISQITLMLGVLIGNIFFGIYADRQGRKKTLLICIFLQSVFGVVAACVPWFWGFVLARFLMAIANGGTTVTSFVMCMEVVGGIWRTIVPILYQIPFGFANSIMAGLAYYYRDWRNLQLVISLLSLFYILYYWLIPESPRWLVVTGQKEKAIEILKKAAKCNKLDCEINKIITRDINSNSINENTNKASISVLFSTKALKKRSILLCANWLIAGITFYAFSQYAGKVGSNIYFTAATSGFVALPGTILCVYIVQRCGRRWTIAAAHLLTGLCFFAILAVPSGVYYQDWPRVAIAGIGIIGLSVSMPALYLFTGELFPTTIRNAGVGLSVMFSRLGSMIAPLVISMHDVSPVLPLGILGVGAVIEMVLVLLLPETKNMSLLETVEDIEKNREISGRKETVHTLNGSYISLPQDADAEATSFKFKIVETEESVINKTIAN